MKEKYLVLLLDGVADYPISELGGKTPLEVAKTPNLDKIAYHSQMGIAKTIPTAFPPGSDVANLSVLGYDPAQYYTGRSPFEALSMGLDLDSTDITLRCNLVTLSAEKNYADKIMKDYSAGEISSQEAKEIITSCQKNLNTQEFSFYPGVSYRHILVWKNGKNELTLTPPHDIINKKINTFLPQGKHSYKLQKLMEASNSFLNQHPVNLQRKEKGLNIANSIWLWGEGTKPNLSSFKSKYGLTGSVISAVDLLKGLGIAAGLKAINVPGATGRIDTNFTGKIAAALKQFNSGDDFVYLHIEAADEASHQGDLGTKIKAIELVDQLIVKEILTMSKTLNAFSFLFLPDHYTPLSKRTHISDPIPFMLYRNYRKKKGNKTFSEKTAQETNLKFAKGHLLMDFFLKK